MLKTLFALVVVSVLAAAGYCGWYVATPVAATRLPAEFEIAPGMRLRGAAQRIEDSGVAIGRLQFELLARALGRAQDVKAGSYELSSAPTPLELLDKLTRGDVTQADVRFIEGWTFRQMRAALDAHTFVRHEGQGLNEVQLLQKLGVRETLAEGLFFPDTYLFSKGTSDIHVLQRSHQAMQRHLAREWETREEAREKGMEGIVNVSVAKQRNGPVGDIKLAWFDKYTCFENLSQKPYEEFGEYQEEF